jgi:hypothetical protein
MRTALRTGCLGVMAAMMLAGCPTPQPMLNPDTGMRDTGPLPDSGPPVDVGPVDAFRADTGGTTGTCSYGGGCDLLAAMSCPDVGGERQACYPGATASECAPAGSLAAGAACDALNDCDTGLVCLSTGTCVAACCGNDDCELGETCRPLADGSGNPLPNGVGVCNRPTACTPLPNSCPAMQQCTLTDTDGSTDCAPVGPNTEGMPCGGAAGGLCVEGLGCYAADGGPAMCIRFCRLGMDADCTGGGTCNASGLGSDTFGLCMGG